MYEREGICYNQVALVWVLCHVICYLGVIEGAPESILSIVNSVPFLRIVYAHLSAFVDHNIKFLALYNGMKNAAEFIKKIQCI